MADCADQQVAARAASLKKGSVVAAAGCGKTEEIAKATELADGRRLILTHTHAGVDALRDRLRVHKVTANKFRVDTIAGWCLRYAASFPRRSKLPFAEPTEDAEWNAVYESAARLIESGAVDSVLTASYTGVFVDEYQDCSVLQHEVVKGLASHLPVCVFGDPLQAIFDFKGQRPVDWDTDVFPFFQKAGELTIPWRWKKVDNVELAKWLATVRTNLERGSEIDLRTRPGCVTWEQLPADEGSARSVTIGACKRAIGAAPDDDNLVVIGDPVKINSRAALAKNLAAVGFSNIEPMNCKNLYQAAKDIEKKKRFALLEAVMGFIERCMTKCEKTAFLDAVRSRQNGGMAGAKKFGDLVSLGVAVVEKGTADTILQLMQGFLEHEATRSYRREMFFAMRAAVKIKATRQDFSLADAIWEVQNKIRHAGRTLGKRSVGSTLLVKGLEFDHAVVVHAHNMNRKDWYVALTRATKSLTILSPSERFTAAA